MEHVALQPLSQVVISLELGLKYLAGLRSMTACSCNLFHSGSE